MPKFIDYHAKMPDIPPEGFSQMKENIMEGRADQFGSVPLNVFVGSRGDAYCLSEAPSAEAVCRSHAEVGVEISPADVHEVNPLV